MNTKKLKSARTLCFTIAKFWRRCFFKFFLRNLYLEGVLKKCYRDPGRGAGHWRRFTLCVCFCVFSSLMLNENLYRSETSVGKNLV